MLVRDGQIKLKTLSARFVACGPSPCIAFATCVGVLVHLLTGALLPMCAGAGLQGHAVRSQIRKHCSSGGRAAAGGAAARCCAARRGAALRTQQRWPGRPSPSL